MKIPTLAFAKTTLFVIALAVIMFFAAGTLSYAEAAKPDKASGGVNLYCVGRGGYLDNTNDYAVQIRRVWIFDGKKTTQSTKEIEAGGKFALPSIMSQESFYIYNKEGVAIGLISDGCVKK